MPSYPQDNYSASDLVRSDFAGNQACSTTRAQGLVDLTLLAVAKRIPADFGTNSRTGSTVWFTLGQLDFRIPEWSVGLYCHVMIGAYMSANTGQLRFAIDAVYGDPVAVSATGSYDEYDVSSDAVTEKGDQIQLTVQMAPDSAGDTIYATGDRYVWFTESA